MAAALITAQEPDENGLDPVYTAATVDGFYFEPLSGAHEVEVINADAAPHDVNFETPFTGGVNALDDNVRTIPAGEKRSFRIKPSVAQFYLATNPDTAKANSVIIFSFPDGTTGMTCALKKYVSG